MTIKWGDPIECNGVRPDWLRDGTPCAIDQGSGRLDNDWAAEEWSWWRGIRAFYLPAEHPAYVALARGFTPWSGGESAPDDWDGGECLARNGDTIKPVHWTHPWNASGDGYVTGDPEAYDVIGYRKREAHTDGSRSGGQPPRRVRYVGSMSPSVQGLIGVITGNPNRRHGGVWEDGSTWVGYMDANLQPVDPSEPVRVVPFTRAEWDAVPDYTAWAQSVGLIRPESRAERFTRETGHAVTEAVEAALNWKEI